MDIAELKLELFRKIDALHEEHLKEAYNLFQEYFNQKSAQSPSLSDAEKKSIEAGLADIREGRVKPHDEVMANLRAKYGQ